jgi:hypothetical protein
MSVGDGIRARAGYLSAQLRWEPPPLAADAAEAVAAQSARQAQAWRALDRQLSQEPAVRGVTFDAFLGVRFFEAVSSSAAAPHWAYVVFVAPNYFAVQDTPVLAGRAFEVADAGNRPVAMVNETFVRTLLPVSDPVGQRVRPFDPPGARLSGDALEIVGVVQDVPVFEISQRGPGWVAQPTVYVPLMPSASTVRMTVRLRNDPQQFVPRLTAIAALIVATGVIACGIPLQRALRIQPTEALRAEG